MIIIVLKMISYMSWPITWELPVKGGDEVYVKIIDNVHLNDHRARYDHHQDCQFYQYSPITWELPVKGGNEVHVQNNSCHRGVNVRVWGMMI